MKTLLIATGIVAVMQLSTAVAEEAKAKKAESATKEAAPAEKKKVEEKKAEKKADVEVTIEGNDALQFDKKEFTVKEGQTVSLTFKNSGTQPKKQMGHNIVILKAGTAVPAFAMDCMPNTQTTGLPVKPEFQKQVLASTKILGPGESETVVFTAPAVGKYDYICSFLGHFGVMKGVMTVEAK